VGYPGNRVPGGTVPRNKRNFYRPFTPGTNALGGGKSRRISSRNTKPTTEDHNLANWLLVRAAALAYGENRLA